MKVVRCSRCGEYIRAGELRYIVGVHVTLDTDGLADGADVVGLATALSTNPDSDEALTEIFTREMAYTLCQSCRDLFVQDPLARPAGTLDQGYVQ